jgi:hypothetical protein
VQWKAVIHDGHSGDSLDWVSLAYLPRNVAPVIDAIAVQDPGVRAQGVNIMPSGQQTSVGLRLPQPANTATSNFVVTQNNPSQHYEQPPQGYQQKGYQSVLWTAHDDNEDDLQYSVYYRGENETGWKLLKDKLDQKFYAWDSTALPDGAYYLKVVATDAQSNTPAEALQGERESDRFVVDNTPPTIERLEATTAVASKKSSPSAQIKFTARDTASSIDHAQYSIDGGDWVLVTPVGNISDALEEHYDFQIPLAALAPGDHTIAVRAYDHFDNVGSAKTTVTIPSSKP